MKKILLTLCVSADKDGYFVSVTERTIKRKKYLKDVKKSGFSHLVFFVYITNTMFIGKTEIWIRLGNVKVNPPQLVFI